MQGFSDNILQFSFEPLVGFEYGKLNELVFSEKDYFFVNGKKTSGKLSELEWNMKPIFYVGGKFAINLNRFNITFSGAGFIPQSCGKMFDSDWQNKNDMNMKTNLSESENNFNQGAFCEAAFSASFNISKKFQIAPKVAACYNYFDFSAKNGFGWYGDLNNSGDGENYSWDDENATYYPKGKLGGIDYIRHEFFIWCGVSLIFSPIKQIAISGTASISPYLFIKSYDYHNHPNGKTKDRYLDEMDSFFSAQRFEMMITYNITNFFSASLQMDLLHINVIKGKSYLGSSSGNDYKLLDSASGAKANTAKFSLVFMFKITKRFGTGT